MSRFISLNVVITVSLVVLICVFAILLGLKRHHSIHPRNTPGQNTTTPKSCLAVVPERRFAILIGVNTYSYEKKLRPLNYCEADVINLRSALIDGGYPTQNIYTILGSSATKKNIEEAIQSVLVELKKYAGEESVLLFAFSGHGGNEYIYPRETDPDRYQVTAYSLKEFLVSINNEKYQHVTPFIFIDACRDKNESDIVFDLGDTRGYTSNKTVIFSACQSGEKSREHPTLGHGIFFRYLIEGLRGYSPTRQDIAGIDYRELSPFVKKSVSSFCDENNESHFKSTFTQGNSEDNQPKGAHDGDKIFSQNPASLNELSAQLPYVVQFADELPLNKLPEQQRRLIVDVIMQPSVNEDWWGYEMPWYLPCFRLALAQEFSAREHTNDYLERHRILANPSSETVQKYLYAQVHKTLPCNCPERKLLRQIVDFTKNDSRLAQSIEAIFDNYTNSHDQRQSRLEKEGESGHYELSLPPREAIIAHTKGVLKHLHYLHYCRESENDIMKEALFKQADELYKEAERLYNDHLKETNSRYLEKFQTITANDGRSDLVTNAFFLLCRSDHARLHLLDYSRHEERFALLKKLVDDLTQQSGNDMSRNLISYPYRVELLTTFASGYGEEGELTDKYFGYAELIARRFLAGHPLHASCLEQRGWYLTDRWHFEDAYRDFNEAKKIRGLIREKSAYPDSLMELFCNYAEHAEATCRRYGVDTIDEESDFVTIGEAADQIFTEDGAFTSYRLWDRKSARTASSYERAADKLLFDQFNSFPPDVANFNSKNCVKYYDNAIQNLKGDPREVRNLRFIEAKKTIAQLLTDSSCMPQSCKLKGNNDDFHKSIQATKAVILLEQNDLGGIRSYLREIKENPRKKELFTRDNMEIHLFLAKFLLWREDIPANYPEDITYLEFLVTRFMDKPHIDYIEHQCQFATDLMKAKGLFFPQGLFFEQLSNPANHRSPLQ